MGSSQSGDEGEPERNLRGAGRSFGVSLRSGGAESGMVAPSQPPRLRDGLAVLVYGWLQGIGAVIMVAIEEQFGTQRGAAASSQSGVEGETEGNNVERRRAFTASLRSVGAESRMVAQASLRVSATVFGILVYDRAASGNC